MNKIVSNFYLIRLGGEPVYVGYTNRHIRTRFNEHKNDKDFGDIEPTVEGLGSLEYDFTWDEELINSYAKEVSARETELILAYNTKDTIWQKGLGTTVGGQTWTNVKHFIRTNRDNPKFGGLSEKSMLAYLETGNTVYRYIKSFVYTMNVPEVVYMKSFVSNMDLPNVRYMKSFVGNMKEPTARYLTNFVSTMNLPETRYMKDFVNGMKLPIVIYMKSFVSHMDLPETTYIRSFVSTMNLPEVAYMKHFVGHMNLPETIYMTGFVGNMLIPEVRYMKDFVNGMKLPIVTYMKHFVSDMKKPIDN